VWEFVRGLLRSPERMRTGPGEGHGVLVEEVNEVERRGYHRLAVKGHMTDGELAAALSELDEIRETAERELEAARARGEALERLERDRDALMESYAGMVEETLDDLVPEERHRIYTLLRVGVRFRPD
jgi:hypothetical protein